MNLNKFYHFLCKNVSYSAKMFIFVTLFSDCFKIFKSTPKLISIDCLFVNFLSLISMWVYIDLCLLDSLENDELQLIEYLSFTFYGLLSSGDRRWHWLGGSCLWCSKCLCSSQIRHQQLTTCSDFSC